MKQKAMVIDALSEFGPMTSHEIDAVVGLGVPKITAYLNDLVADVVVDRQRDYTRYLRFDHAKNPRYNHRWHLR